MVLILFVALGVWTVSRISQAELTAQTEQTIAIRVDRAARTAAAIVSGRAREQLSVTRDGRGQPLAYQVVSGLGEDILTPSMAFDGLVEEIARVNQGFVNLFRYDGKTHEFVRVATSMRTPDGGYVREVRFGAAHPAFGALVRMDRFIGEVPQRDRMRYAYLTPILGEHSQIAGALAVDVGWVDDLWQASFDLKSRIDLATMLIMLVVAFVGGLMLYFAMRPMRQIARYASDVANNAESGPVPFLGRGDEIGQLAVGMAQVVDMRGRLEKLAYFDPVTGKPNRARVEYILARKLIEARQKASVFGLIMFGIDHFRSVNDTFGHKGGDDLLRQIAQALSGELGPDDIVGRISADEFLIIAPVVRNQKDARALAQRCIDRLDRPFRLPQGDVYVSASAGVSLLPREGENASEAMRDVSLALHKAKLNGRRQIMFSSVSHNVEARRAMELQRELRHALENNQLSLVFQPQIDAKSLELYGVEALVRWHHPEQGAISPVEFIPVAEDSGLIVDIGRFVLDEACRTARQWLDCGFAFKHISVNISPIQLWQRRFDRMISNILVKHGLPPHCLCLEVTEGVFANREASRVQEVLTRLSRLGVTLSLDDFGTGYSSLGYLQEMPFTQLKIDRTFVSKVHESGTKTKLLAGIIALGHGMRLQIVAEGVETDEEYAVIRSLGCEAVQGYYFARPVSALLVPIEADRIRRMGLERADVGKPTLKIAK